MLTSRRVYLLSSFQVVKCTQYYSFSYINKSFCFQTYMSDPSENFLTSVPSLTATLYIFNGSKLSLMFTCLRPFGNFKRHTALNYHYLYYL